MMIQYNLKISKVPDFFFLFDYQKSVSKPEITIKCNISLLPFISEVLTSWIVIRHIILESRKLISFSLASLNRNKKGKVGKNYHFEYDDHCK